MSNRQDNIDHAAVVALCVGLVQAADEIAAENGLDGRKLLNTATANQERCREIIAEAAEAGARALKVSTNDDGSIEVQELSNDEFEHIILEGADTEVQH